MEYFAISVFKRELRKALRKDDQEPIGITKNGKLILVLVSIQTYELLHKYKDLPLELWRSLTAYIPDGSPPA